MYTYGYTTLRPRLDECPGYDIKQSDGEAPVTLEFREMQSTPFIAIAPRSTLTWRGSDW